MLAHLRVANQFVIPGRAQREPGIHSHRVMFGEDSELPARAPAAPWDYGSRVRCAPRMTAVSGGRPPVPVGYGFASAACSTALQAAGICASVIGGFGFGGSGGGFGCSTASLNQ